MTTLPNKNLLPNVSGLVKVGNNRYIRILDNGLLFYSYSQPVVLVLNGEYVYKTSKFWSTTTSRHIAQFCEESGYIPEVVNQEFIDSYNK